MEDRWIILTTYTDIETANLDANALKAEGIECAVNWDSAEEAIWSISDEEERWITLDVKEEDYETAAEILELKPRTVEEFYQEHQYTEEFVEQRRKRGLIIWGGFVAGVIVLRILLDLI